MEKPLYFTQNAYAYKIKLIMSYNKLSYDELNSITSQKIRTFPVDVFEIIKIIINYTAI